MEDNIRNGLFPHFGLVSLKEMDCADWTFESSHSIEIVLMAFLMSTSVKNTTKGTVIPHLILPSSLIIAGIIIS